MARRPTLAELRVEVLDHLASHGGWLTPSQLVDALGLGHGYDWVRVALVCERLANDRVLELKTPGGRTRRFRLRRPA
jgi:hypothetical protein